MGTCLLETGVFKEISHVHKLVAAILQVLECSTSMKHLVISKYDDNTYSVMFVTFTDN